MSKSFVFVGIGEWAFWEKYHDIFITLVLCFYSIEDGSNANSVSKLPLNSDVME